MTNIEDSKSIPATKFDTVSEQLVSKKSLITKDLVALKIVDTTVTMQLGESSYCDTTVQLNDSIYYSVITVNAAAGVCSYNFLASVDNKNKKIIGSKYLHPDCDIDYSLDAYEFYAHSIISKNKIQLSKTTVFQKKNRTSANEEDNIDYEQEQKVLLQFHSLGKLNNSK